jgi:hypothetical protein
MNWNNIINWCLLGGSHKFPGPDGGTCINEAAIVAAGFEYREVKSAGDCPPCFSRVIAAYAIKLNDSMPDDLRQELLLPFVTRLSGTADSVDVEAKRAVYIVVQTVKSILPITLRMACLEDHAKRCGAVDNLKSAKAAANAAYAANAANAAADAVYAAARAATYAAAYADSAVYAADAAVYAADAAADAAAYADSAVYAADAAARKHVFQIAANILDEAIKLGNQAAPIELALVQSRMDAVKRHALIGAE